MTSSKQSDLCGMKFHRRLQCKSSEYTWRARCAPKYRFHLASRLCSTTRLVVGAGVFTKKRANFSLDAADDIGSRKAGETRRSMTLSRVNLRARKRRRLSCWAPRFWQRRFYDDPAVIRKTFACSWLHLIRFASLELNKESRLKSWNCVFGTHSWAYHKLS